MKKKYTISLILGLFIILSALKAISCASDPEGTPKAPPQEPVQTVSRKPAEPLPVPAVIPAEIPAVIPAVIPAEEPVEEPVKEPVEEQAEEPVEEPVKEPEEIPAEEAVQAAAEEVFDPANVSAEVYISTRDDVRQFISDLNQIIRRQDFDSWRAALSQEHIEELSSHENLSRASELLRVTIRNLEDYFRRVVVPSRANVSDNVDNIDIEFLSEYRVKAFTVTPTRTGEMHQVQLYDLEKVNNSWIIIK